ncbi:MAG: DUF1501 domain-containing protein [Rhizobiaceae bacterium]
MAEPALVVIFLRGGADGLSIVSPTGDKNYAAARPVELRVVANGDNKGFKLKDANADAGFHWHGQAKGLSELYDAGELAVVHATGLADGTRSHFDAEDRMERAAPGAGSAAGGWLARWLKAVKPEGILPALAIGPAAPDSLRGALEVAVAQDLSGLRLAPGHGYSSQIRAMLAKQLGQDALMGAPVARILQLSNEIEAKVALTEDGQLKPYEASAEYPRDNPLSEPLKSVAQAIKLDLGLRVTTVDFGGWDTHVNQAGDIAQQIRHLSSAVQAFWRDLGDRRGEVSVVVMSEFGRRLKSNSSGGTDHGHGNIMLMLGPRVQGGRMYGDWPGLDNDALDEGADLAITTDYRHVLAEIMNSHMGFADSGVLFPKFQAKPLGFSA